jgi:tetratricopeptide (TPR) repeat protein
MSGLPGVAAERVRAARSLVAAGDSASLISAAEVVTDSLGGRHGGEYAKWLKATVGSLKVVDDSVIQAIVDLGVPIATTNYDGLIERVSGWERVTALDGAAMQRALQGEEQAIVHLHGHWRVPASVVLGVRSYEMLAGSAVLQSLQMAMAAMHSLLFIGVGDGASDPNVGALRRWMASTFPDSEFRHFRLCLDPEVGPLSTFHASEERIVPISYGTHHDELPAFLRTLSGVTSDVPAPPPRTERAPNPALPARPVTIGREDEIALVVGRLLDPAAVPVLLHGAPGIGKTNLTLAALHHLDVSERFRDRRWFVRCEAATSSGALVAALADSVGLAGETESLSSVIAHLACRPGVVALDNLETPWDADTLAVEEVLAALAGIRGLSVVVTLRGAERPGSLRWTDPVPVEPLDRKSARQVFFSIAPRRFGTRELPKLLDEMGGVPLAVELLAHVAEGEPSVEHLVARWRTERAHLLKRGRGDHRLLSIAVSIDLSWNSPAMTNPARRLLSLLGQLPDGIANEDLEVLLPGVSGPAANLLRRKGLAIDNPKRLRTLPPIRHHLAEAHPPDADDWQRAISHYCDRAETLGALAGREGGATAIAKLASDMANVTAAIQAATTAGPLDHGYKAALAVLEAARFGGLDGSLPSATLQRLAERSHDANFQAKAYFAIALVATGRSDHDTGRRNFERALSLYQELGSMVGEANCIRSLAELALRRSDHDAARAGFAEALPLYQQIGDLIGEANCIRSLAELARRHSEHDTAEAGFARALPLYQQADDVLGEAHCIRGLADIALERSDYDAARAGYEKALPLYRRIGSVLGEANCKRSLAELARRRSDHGGARTGFMTALPLYQQIGDVLGEAHCTRGLADLALDRSDCDSARSGYQRSLRLYRQIREPQSVGLVCRALARIETDQKLKRNLVGEARIAWLSINRQDLVTDLDAEFGQCN